MAKTNKYVHFKTRAAFDKKCPNPSAAEGNEFYYYTVFIKDTGEIYTHGKFYGQNYFELTYDEIKSLRDNGKLIPGAKYRMIDYVTTTNNLYDTDAEPFDLVLTAISNSTFDPQVTALHNDNSSVSIKRMNVEDWKIWYTLDNQSYSWVDQGKIIKTIDRPDSFFDQDNNTFIDLSTFHESIVGSIAINFTGYNNLRGDVILEAKCEKTQYGYQLVLYKTSQSEYPDEPDYNDQIIYWGWSEEHQGTLWRKMDDELTYDSEEELYYISSLTEEECFGGGKIKLTTHCLTPGSKGVIYRMIDEWGNDCPFDFKNIYIDGTNKIFQSNDMTTWDMYFQGRITNNIIKSNNFNLPDIKLTAPQIHNNTIGHSSCDITSSTELSYNSIGDWCVLQFMLDEFTYNRFGNWIQRIFIERSCIRSSIGDFLTDAHFYALTDSIIGSSCNRISFNCLHLTACTIGAHCSYITTAEDSQKNIPWGKPTGGVEIRNLTLESNSFRILLFNDSRNISDNIYISSSCSRISSDENDYSKVDLTVTFNNNTFGQKNNFIAMRNSDGEIKVFNLADLIA